MKMTRAKIEFTRLPKDYAGLCRVHMPRPIRDKVEFENVTEITDAMAGHKLTPDQGDFFDLLSRLIEGYEKEQGLTVPNASGLDVLRLLLDVHELNAAGLARLLGVHRTLGGMILRGERNLTVNHVRTLARHFGVSADAFLA